MFHGYDFDTTMLRIGSMNMLLHGVESPDIRYRDSLVRGRSRRRGDVLADPGQPAVRRQPRLRVHRQGPAAGRQDQEDRAALPRAVPPAAQARRPGGGHRARRRAVRLVARRTRTLRRILVEDQKLDAVVKLPVRRLPAVRRRLDRDPVLHQDQLRRHRPRLVLRRPGRRLQPRRQAQPRSRPTTCPDVARPAGALDARR